MLLMLTSSAWPQATDPNFPEQTTVSTNIYWEEGGEPEGVYIYSIYEHNISEGRVRDNEMQVRDQMQVIDIRVIRRVRQEETEVRKLKNTFSASLSCIHLLSGHHLCRLFHATFRKSVISRPQREDRSPRP